MGWSASAARFVHTLVLLILRAGCLWFVWSAAASVPTIVERCRQIGLSPRTVPMMAAQGQGPRPWSDTWYAILGSGLIGQVWQFLLYLVVAFLLWTLSSRLADWMVPAAAGRCPRCGHPVARPAATAATGESAASQPAPVCTECGRPLG